MNKKVFLVSLFCITIIFVGALIARGIRSEDIRVRFKTVNLDSVPTADNQDDSCETLCRQAYCDPVDSANDCPANTELCITDCEKVGKSLGDLSL